jgi:hypothetical protein
MSGISVKTVRLQILLCLLVGVTCGGIDAQSIPRLTAESLNGKNISLPEDFGGKSAILVVGFSRAGGNQCASFARKLVKEPSVVEGKVIVYQIAVLESAPRFIRPMILHGMRSGIPKTEQGRFLPLFRNEKQWKQVAGFTVAQESDSYLLLADPDGTVRWTGHGQYSDALYTEFKRHLP